MPNIKQDLEGSILKKVLFNLSRSEPVTTLLGVVVAGLVATKIDYSKLIAGDVNELANTITAVLIAVIGYYTNHGKLVAKTTDLQEQKEIAVAEIKEDKLN